jgi:pyruvate,water dikinase
LNLLARKSIGIIGEKIQKNSDLNDPYDLFFLKKDELEQISNFKLDENTIKKIYYRKKQYLNAFKEEPNWELNNIEKPINSDKNIFFGTPGSPGEFEGQVYLVNGVEDFSGLPNDSILIAKTTNPAWTVLFYKAKAVITESGGPLSHGAVTARELGLPAVMSVRGCMNIFSNGELVRINGTKGFVEKLN